MMLVDDHTECDTCGFEEEHSAYMIAHSFLFHGKQDRDT